MSKTTNQQDVEHQSAFNFPHSSFRWVTLAIILATLLKVILLLVEAVPFNGDEAIVALMARHINQGAQPTFFYGQAYMGSVDAWLVAGSFRLFGEHVASIRIVQITLYGLYLLTLWVMLRRFFRDPRVADFGVLLAAIPPVLLTTYTTATLGGYGEVLVLGNLVLLLGYEVIFGDSRQSYWAWLLLGLVGGIGFWILGMMGIYLMTVAVVGLWKFSFKSMPWYLVGLLGFMLGSAPWWLYNLSNDWLALKSFFDSGLMETTFWEHLLGFVLLGIPSLVGLRFPWTQVFAPWPVMLLILLLLQAAIIFLVRAIRRDELGTAPGVKAFLGALGGVFCLIFLGSQFGIDATGRYFLPLYVIFFALGGAFVAFLWQKKQSWGIALLVVLLGLGAFETWRAAASEDKITTQFDPITRFDNQADQELMAFLEENGELRGYTNYWVAYRLAFLSGESIVYSPRLPYKSDLSYTPKDNRYPLYDQVVAESKKVAYITSKHPELDEIIRQRFSENGVAYQEEQIGDYHIFYDLSESIRPEILGPFVDSGVGDS